MPVTETDHAARAALKARQGKGARYDAPNAPAEDLLLARRGAAYFARKLMELSDDELYRPAAVEGLTRAHVVARVSYAARQQALALGTMIRGESYGPGGEKQQLPELALAATLPARALRHLFSHSEVHLNTSWRDLTDTQWDQQITLPGGLVTAARALPLLRAKHIWHAAVDLGNGARIKDVPQSLR